MKNKFDTVSNIHTQKQESWKYSLFITFDIDWVCDDVLSDTIDLVEKAGISATWFITHDTPLLQNLRKNSKFELGIHPNFNFLWDGDKKNGATTEEIVDRLLYIVPESKSVRSHSITQSSKLFQLFVDKGLTHDCNSFIPEQSQIELKPWQLWNGLIKVPYFWEDDATCLYDYVSPPMSQLAQRKGIKVFDFHPIHVFLNTENLDRYERTRHLHQKPDELVKHRYQGEGTRTRLLELLNLATEKTWQNRSIEL